MSGTFLDKWLHWGHPSGGLGQDAWNKAIAAGYSGKQIAVASHKNQAAGNIIWPKFEAARQAAAQAAKGSPNNWIHNYVGGSGGVGMAGLQQGLAAGRSLDEMIAATAPLHRENNNWGVAGFGQGASRWILDKRQRDEFRSQQDAMNAANREQMSAMMELYNKPKKGGSSNAYAVGKGGNTELKASRGSRRRSNVRARYGRGGAGFQSAVNTNTGGGKAGSSGAKSLNV